MPENGIVLKAGNDVILPVSDDNMTFMAYSENGRSGEWNMPDADFTRASVYSVTPYGNKYICDEDIADGKIRLELKAGQAVAIKGIC